MCLPPFFYTPFKYRESDREREKIASEKEEEKEKLREGDRPELTWT